MVEPKAEKKENATEKAETTGEKPKGKKVKQRKGVPVYIALLLLVVGAVGGYTVGYLNHPPVEVDLVQPQPLEEKVVSAVMVYDSTCSVCDPVHSLLNVMTLNKINAVVKPVDAKSPEGINAIRNYDLNVLPTLLLKDSTIDNSMILRTEEENVPLRSVALSAGEKRGDVIIVEDRKFDGKPRVLVIANPPCALMSANAFVELFIDPYDPFSIQSTLTINDLRERFTNTPILYNYAKSYSALLEPIHGTTKTELLARHLICAADQNKQKFLDFEQCYLRKYCDKDLDGNLLNEEVIKCYEANPHFQLPLDEAEINSCVEEVSLDKEELDECLQNVDGKIDLQKDTREKFFVNETPLAVINCKYIVPIKDIEKTICFIKPDTVGCVS